MMQRRAPLWPLILAPLLATPLACGPAPAPAPRAERGYQRLELRPERTQREPRTRRVARLEVPRNLRPWHTDAEAHHLGVLHVDPDSPPQRALTLEGSGRRTLTIPGPLEAGTFSQVTVSLRTPANARVEVELLRRGQAVLASETIVVRGSDAAQTLTFDLPAARFESRAFEALRLVVQGSRACQIGAVEIVDRPLSAWLPPVRRDPPHVALGEESRPALGLSSRMPLKATLRAPAGGVLALSVRHLPQLAPRGQSARLVVELVDRLGRQTRELLPLDAPGRAGTWRELTLALGLHAGYELDLTLSLVASGGHDAFALITSPIVHVPAPDPPTVLLVTSDAHRFDHVGAHPRSVEVSTPTLDALAQSGVFFEDCWGTTNRSLPAHAALLTGLGPLESSERDPRRQGASRARGPTTLAERFRDLGWATRAVLSSAELSPAASDLGRGFERVDAPERGLWRADATLERAMGSLGAHPDRPLFLWVHLADARAPYSPPPERIGAYWPPERGNPFSPRRPALDLPERALPPWLRGLRDLEFPSALYRGEITQLDLELAGLLAQPRLAGAVVAFTASHGESLGERGVFWDHQGLHPEVLRVPLVLAGPALASGRRVSRSVAQLDLGRTLLDLAGHPGAAFPGRSLLGPGPDPSAPEPRFALAAEGESAAVLLGPWLYLRTLRDHDAPSLVAPRRAGESELYHLERDPGCADDLLRTEAERAARMQALLESRLAELPPP